MDTNLLTQTQGGSARPPPTTVTGTGWDWGGRTSPELSEFCSTWSHINRRKEDLKYEFKEGKQGARA